MSSWVGGHQRHHDHPSPRKRGGCCSGWKTALAGRREARTRAPLVESSVQATRGGWLGFVVEHKVGRRRCTSNRSDHPPQDTLWGVMLVPALQTRTGGRAEAWRATHHGGKMNVHHMRDHRSFPFRPSWPSVSSSSRPWPWPSSASSWERTGVRNASSLSSRRRRPRPRSAPPLTWRRRRGGRPRPRSA